MRMEWVLCYFLVQKNFLKNIKINTLQEIILNSMNILRLIVNSTLNGVNIFIVKETILKTMNI